MGESPETDDPPGVNRILLVGMMGAGKTTTGKALAGLLGFGYFDSDRMIEQDTGKTVVELWAAGGEKGFRAEESRVLSAAVRRDRAIISVAGGALLDPENRRLVREAGTVVWLRARPDTLARRVGSGEGRPLLEGDPAAAIARLEPVRRPYYDKVADVVVDVDDLSPSEVVDRILGSVGTTRRGA